MGNSNEPARQYPRDARPTSGCGTKGCDIARGIADEAVARVFSIFGVDINNAGQVKEFQQTIWFGESIRKIWWKVALAFFTSLGTFVASLLIAMYFYNSGGH